MTRSCLLVLCLLLAVSQCAYQPELMLTATSELINKEISQKLGKNISEALNNATIKDISFEDKVSGVKVKFNLTHIKQHVDISWKANILTVKDKQSFAINSKNVNLTLDGELELKLGLTRKQKGPLKIVITQLEVDTTLKLGANTCPKSVGFNIQISDVFVNAHNISVKIQGKAFDNLIISTLEKYIIPRVPTILNNLIQDKVNPLIITYTCNRIEEEVPIGDQNYIVIVNTTKVPEFDAGLKYLGLPLDITFVNLKSNATNDELEKDDLPANMFFQNTSDASVALSSNFINTVLWLIDDSNLLHVTVTNAMLGDNPPILLNTTNLSILMPKLKQEWPNKEVFLMIEPSSRYEHLMIHSGRFVSVLSLSVKFVVNVTEKITNVTECIEKKGCIVACDLNMTLPLSLAMNINKKTIRAIVHSLSFHDIQIIHSLIDINLASLRSIINSIVGSMLPTINGGIQAGIPIPDNIQKMLAKFDISEIKAQTFLDFLAAGLIIDL